MTASGQKPYQEGRAAMKKVAYVGIDYHLDFLAIAVVIEGQKKIHETVRIANQDKVIRKYLKKLSSADPEMANFGEDGKSGIRL
jgi:hypothetical protein